MRYPVNRSVSRAQAGMSARKASKWAHTGRSGENCRIKEILLLEGFKRFEKVGEFEQLERWNTGISDWWGRARTSGVVRSFALMSRIAVVICSHSLIASDAEASPDEVNTPDDDENSQMAVPERKSGISSLQSLQFQLAQEKAAGEAPGMAEAAVSSG